MNKICLYLGNTKGRASHNEPTDCHYEYGIEYIRWDLHNAQRAQTSDECQQVCASSLMCTHFTFNTQEMRCYTKSGPMNMKSRVRRFRSQELQGECKISKFSVPTYLPPLSAVACAKIDELVPR